MTKQEFLAEIAKTNIDPDVFGLGDRILFQGYGICEERGLWIVFYTERGEKNELHLCASESEALVRLLKILKKDRSAKW
jgi:hypothetical protein